MSFDAEPKTAKVSSTTATQALESKGQGRIRRAPVTDSLDSLGKTTPKARPRQTEPR